MTRCAACSGVGWQIWETPCDLYACGTARVTRRCAHCGGGGKVNLSGTQRDGAPGA